MTTDAERMNAISEARQLLRDLAVYSPSIPLYVGARAQRVLEHYPAASDMKRLKWKKKPDIPDRALS